MEDELISDLDFSTLFDLDNDFGNGVDVHHGHEVDAQCFDKLLEEFLTSGSTDAQATLISGEVTTCDEFLNLTSESVDSNTPSPPINLHTMIPQQEVRLEPQQDDVLESKDPSTWTLSDSLPLPTASTLLGTTLPYLSTMEESTQGIDEVLSQLNNSSTNYLQKDFTYSRPIVTAPLSQINPLLQSPQNVGNNSGYLNFNSIEQNPHFPTSYHQLSSVGLGNANGRLSGLNYQQSLANPTNNKKFQYKTSSTPWHPLTPTKVTPTNPHMFTNGSRLAPRSEELFNQPNMRRNTIMNNSLTHGCTIDFSKPGCFQLNTDLNASPQQVSYGGQKRGAGRSYYDHLGEVSTPKRTRMDSFGTERGGGGPQLLAFNSGRKDNHKTNPRVVRNSVYDPLYERMGLPCDPHLRCFARLNQTKGGKQWF